MTDPYGDDARNALYTIEKLPVENVDPA